MPPPADPDLPSLVRKAQSGDRPEFEQLLLATTRAALASAAAALLWSLYLILTGLLFTAPWLLLAWLLWKLSKKRKPT